MGPLGLPTSLADLLANTLVLRQTAPYLPVASIFALAATSRTLYNVIFQSPEAFRYLDLSTVQSAAVVPYEPLDSGGISWRYQRMDESLTVRYLPDSRTETITPHAYVQPYVYKGFASCGWPTC